MEKRKNSKISHFNQKTLNEIKQSLLDRKERIERDIKDLSGTSGKENFDVAFPDFGNKRDEQAYEVATFSENLSLDKTLEKILKDINKALKNIENGTYGFCKYCKAKIPEARLKIRPASSSCVNCKKRLKGEK